MRSALRCSSALVEKPPRGRGAAPRRGLDPQIVPVLDDPARERSEGVDVPQAHREPPDVRGEPQDVEPRAGRELGRRVRERLAPRDGFERARHRACGRRIGRRLGHRAREQALGFRRGALVGRRLGPQDHGHLPDADPPAAVEGEQRIEGARVRERGVNRDRGVGALGLPVRGEGVEVERHKDGARGVCPPHTLDRGMHERDRGSRPGDQAHALRGLSAGEVARPHRPRLGALVEPVAFALEAEDDVRAQHGLGVGQGGVVARVPGAQEAQQRTQCVVVGAREQRLVKHLKRVMLAMGRARPSCRRIAFGAEHVRGLVPEEVRDGSGCAPDRVRDFAHCRPRRVA